jgi:hypothetical protein
MRRTFPSLNCSRVQTEATPRQPHTFTALPIPDGFRKTRWPDVSAIAYSHSTDDESIEEVLKELKTLALKDLDSKAPSEFSSNTLEGSTQFEKTEAREGRYSRVLRRVKTRETHYPT